MSSDDISDGLCDEDISCSKLTSVLILVWKKLSDKLCWLSNMALLSFGGT